MNNVEFAQAISRLLGWIYWPIYEPVRNLHTFILDMHSCEEAYFTIFLSWSISFYPQPWLNWRRRSTDGFTADMAGLNIVGFICYLTSTAAFLYSPTVIHQYALRHPLSPETTIRFNDFAFALHAVVLCSIIISQFWHRLWHFEGKSKPMSSTAIGIIAGSSVGVGIVAILAWKQDEQTDDATAWGAIDVIYALSYVKLLITFIKYIPQAWHNYKRKSTTGWAIQTILLDFTGGVLSLAQLIIDSSLQADWSGVTGNPVKFGLSVVTLVFDSIFIIQHYVLYQHESRTEGDAGETHSGTAPLLA